jgi:hypothetical protein
MVWPDPPAVAAVKVQEANPVPGNALPFAAPSKVDARPVDNPKGVTQIVARTSEAAKTTAASTGTIAEILLVVALGLTVASLLYRLVTKITAARDRRILMAHSGLDWAHDDRLEHQFRQRGFINEQEKFVDDMRLSLVPTADEYGVRRTHPIAPQSNELRAGSAPQIAPEFREHENKWTQLLRDLDKIMQSGKEA